MTRKEIEKEYDLKDGRIVSPGKFQGEAIYMPYFWNLFLEGWADGDDGQTIRFKVSSDDRAEFPELVGKQRVVFYQRDDGFVIEL